MQAYVGAGRAALYKLECELPSLSRPLYECILTGVPPIQSGIVHNQVARLSNQRSIFHYATDAGLSTAAAAYHWVSELYNRTPFDPPLFFIWMKPLHTCIYLFSPRERVN